MIDKATVEKIKDAADIVEVVSDYVHLVRRGSNYMGLCPFHNEKTPSFSVNKARNFCYCFSCHKGGSPVNFIMEKEGISYHDALLQLAKKYGITVEERQLTDAEREAQTLRESMYLANEWAMQQMQEQLTQTDEGRDIGLQYLYQRGITDEAIRQFRLGYDSDGGFALANAAKAKGFESDLLCEMGLLGKSERGHYYDKYRGRVIFPIFNSSGKPIGFGGRDLKGGPAKYINSPESAVYKKNQELYGIYQARQEIVKEDRCYLVEGYLDVIGMWQTGMKNVVASSGTALTDGQITLIHRFTDKVTLIYDGDAAGIKAALRGINMLLDHNLDVNVLLLPDGHDPDSFARTRSNEEFRKYISDNQSDIIRFKIKVLLDQAGDNPQQRAWAVNSVVDSIAHIPDRVKRDIYIQECSRLLGIKGETIAQATARARQKVVEELRRRNLSPHTEAQDPTPDAGKTATPAQPQLRPADYPLYPLEKKVVELCIRYAYLDFCEAYDEDDHPFIVNVLEFVNADFHEDNIRFTFPPFTRIMTILGEMLPEYRSTLPSKQAEIEESVARMREEGIARIAAMDISVSRIRHEEQLLEEELKRTATQMMKDYSIDYPSRRLMSHEDSEIREIATLAVRERYRLSNIYSRERPAQQESDRINPLLPRAMTELKNGILDQKLGKLMAEFRQIAGKGDIAREHELQMELGAMMAKRSLVAKNIGERIICPASRR